MATSNRPVWLAAGGVVLLVVAFGGGYVLGGGYDDVSGSTPTLSVTASPEPEPEPSDSPSAEPTESPTPEPAIEDGRHFAFITEISAEGAAATITFDLAYFLTGEEAVEAAAERGDESPPPNDYYIVNDNPRLRTMPLADDPVILLLDGGSALLLESDLAALERKLAEQGDLQNGSWLTVTDGIVAHIEEQYRP